jgi:hypothetical protein
MKHSRTDRRSGLGGLLTALLISAGFGVAVVPPVFASSLLTYEVSGTFTDGATFSGTFGYDPITNSYTDGFMGDQFDITTSNGAEGQGNHYVPFQSPLYYSDEGSAATAIGVSGSTGLSDDHLLLEWDTALNAAGGGSMQSITGGYEQYVVATPGCSPQAYCISTLDDRQVASGFVELVAPVPLPTAIWLLLTGLLVPAAAGVRRRG